MVAAFCLWNSSDASSRIDRCPRTGWKRNGVGLTNSRLMEMLLDTWQDINPGAVTFPDVNTTGTKIQIRVPSSLTPKGTPYCPGKELRYAWEDFPECAIYNTDGLPLPPFNVTLSVGAKRE